mgnify:CR=1 FL=1
MRYPLPSPGSTQTNPAGQVPGVSPCRLLAEQSRRLLEKYRAGREAAWRALENTLPVLRDGREARFLFLPEGEDPDTLVRKIGREAFEERVAHATHLSDFLFDHLSDSLDLDSIDGRARLVDLARPLLARLPDGIFHQLMQGHESIQQPGPVLAGPGQKPKSCTSDHS